MSPCILILLYLETQRINLFLLLCGDLKRTLIFRGSSVQINMSSDHYKPQHYLFLLDVIANRLMDIKGT